MYYTCGVFTAFTASSMVMIWALLNNARLELRQEFTNVIYSLFQNDEDIAGSSIGKRLFLN